MAELELAGQAPDTAVPAIGERAAAAEVLRPRIQAFEHQVLALEEELQAAVWERDCAQRESAFLREEMHGVREPWRLDNRPLGQLVLSGDPEPLPGADDSTTALVAVGSGRVFLHVGENRPHHVERYWAELGVSHQRFDWASLGEHGPFVTVAPWAVHDHQRRIDAGAQLRQAMYDARPHVNHVPWPDERTLELANDVAVAGAGIAPPSERAAAMISKLGTLSGVLRAAWADERNHVLRLERQLEQLREAGPDA